MHFGISRAAAIEVELDYTSRHLKVLVRDDGEGIDSGVLREGRDGHWGLSGMRERADRIGAKFTLRSQAGGGTEVELSVPADVAFGRDTSRRPQARFKRLGLSSILGNGSKRKTRSMIEAGPFAFSASTITPLLRKGIKTIIGGEPEMQLIAEASSGEEAIEQFRRHRPDVTLMDLRIPRMSGVDAMIAIRAEFPDTRIIILTTFEGDAEIQRALEAGARAYMLKTMDPEEMVQTVRHVHAGKKRVFPEIAVHLAEHYSDEFPTPREVEVLQQIANGRKNRDIADKLFISEHTVKVHIKHIMEKLGAGDRTDAVAIGVRRGFIQL